MANKLDDLMDAFGNACPTEELTSADKGIGAFAEAGAGKIATQQIKSRIRRTKAEKMRTSIVMSKELLAQVDAMAADLECSRSEVINQAIAWVVDEYAKSKADEK